jgi:hypothetical protein
VDSKVSGFLDLVLSLNPDDSVAATLKPDMLITQGVVLALRGDPKLARAAVRLAQATGKRLRPTRFWSS